MTFTLKRTNATADCDRDSISFSVTPTLVFLYIAQDNADITCAHVIEEVCRTRVETYANFLVLGVFDLLFMNNKAKLIGKSVEPTFYSTL